MGYDQAVNDSFDGMDLVAVEGDLIFEVKNLSIHAGAHETGFADLFKNSLVSTLAAAHQGSQNQNAAAFRQGFNGFYDLLGGLFNHLAPADGAVRPG